MSDAATVRCTNCEGEGWIDCGSCSGQGYSEFWGFGQNCSSCANKGARECPVCEGGGRQDRLRMCPLCEEVDLGWVTNSWALTDDVIAEYPEDEFDFELCEPCKEEDADTSAPPKETP